MEETMMNTTNEVFEEVADTKGIKPVAGVAIALGVAAGVTFTVIAVKKLIAKYKAKKAEAEDREYDVEDDE